MDGDPLVFLLLPLLLDAQVTVGHLLTENRVEPIGLDLANPRFSWKLAGERRGILQSAYEIKVMSGEAIIWNSGKVISDQSTFVSYAGPPLTSDQSCKWQVRIWDDKNHETDWSATSAFHLGFLKVSDWKARWIMMDPIKPSVRSAQMFRKDFSAKKQIQAARLYISAHGIYEASINGKRVGGDHLTPGWTSYNKRIQYQVYDVTTSLSKGDNTLAAEIGNGWYRGNLAWESQQDVYGKALGLLAQLMITYKDGSTELVVTDQSWKSAISAIEYSEIYHGETFDARKLIEGWNEPGFDDANWNKVSETPELLDDLVGTYNEPVRQQEKFEVVKLITTPKGEKVLDFGQNLVGFVRVKVNGQSGGRIVLSHSEVLDKAGNFYTESLRSAKQRNTFILKGGSEETFEPRFTWQGFRYVRVDEYPGTINPKDFTAIALYSDMPLTGKFTSSNELINQLQHNIQWGQRGNFIDVPTDCPQRDERLGWTGDAQAFSRTAAFNFDVHNFFSKWMKDVAADQSEDGSVPYVVPHVLGANAGGSAGWADAATIIPWNMYLVYGDQKILEDQYKSMQGWIRFMMNNSSNFLWNKGFHFGDWLFYRPADDNDGRSAVTDKYLIAQCFFAHSTQLMINTAEVLGKEKRCSTIYRTPAKH